MKTTGRFKEKAIRRKVYRMADKILNLAGKQGYYEGDAMEFCGYGIRIIGHQVLFRRQIIIEFGEIVFEARNPYEILTFYMGSWVDLLEEIYKKISLFVKAEHLCSEWQKYKCSSDKIVVEAKNTPRGNYLEVVHRGSPCDKLVYSQEDGTLDYHDSWMQEMQSVISHEKGELSRARDERAKIFIERLRSKA